MLLLFTPRNFAQASDLSKLLCVTSFNARSICNKLPELHSLLYHDNRHVIAITETWLCNNVPDGLLDPECKYRIFRCDRDARRGGGVCVFVNREFNAVEVNVCDDYPDLELLCIDVIYCKAKCRLITVYRSTDHAQQSVAYTKQLVHCIEGLSCISWPCYITGDLNAPNIDWSNLVTLHSCADECIMNFAIDNGFTQMVSVATRNNNILDLVLTNEPNTLFHIQVDSPIGRSDHCCVNFTVAFESGALHVPSNANPSTDHLTAKRYRWNDGDYEGIANYLSAFDWSHLFSVNLTVDSMWSAFSDVIYQAVDIFVPVCKAPSKVKKRYPKTARKALARKRCLWRKLRAEPDNASLLQKYKESENHCHQILRDLELAKERRVVSSNNLGNFYKYVNNRLSCHTGVGVLRDNNGSLYATDDSKAELLNNYFSSVSTKDDGVLPEFDRLVPENVEFSNVTFTPENVMKAIRKLKNNTSCGPDGLPPILFRKLASHLALPLSLLFNNSMSVGRIPDDWKKAIITPISKGGLASDVCNYRPISLTSVACKIMERVIVQHLLSYLYQHGLISRQQHGFLLRKSTTTNLLETINDWTLAIDGRDGVVTAYIDFAKAFDSVSHPKLYHKLQGYGISGSMLAWIKDFLSARFQCTRVGDSVSTVEYLISGVIQGSCLGPILFVLYINDIVQLFDECCTCKLYADDLKLYMHMKSPDCATMFQKHLDKLVVWSKHWQLKIAYKKCSIMQLGNTINNPVFYLDSDILTNVDTVKDLGILVDCRLKFECHINKIVARASIRANLIHKCFLSKDISTMTRAFTTYVRPLLEYASCVWSPCSIKDVKRIESVQRRFTKRLPGMTHFSYASRLKAVGLDTLEHRRLQQDLLHTYKILFGKLNIDYTNMFCFRLHSITRGHQWKLYPNFHRTNLRKKFFCERVIAPWNSLDITNDDVCSNTAFKRLVERSDLSAFMYFQ